MNKKFLRQGLISGLVISMALLSGCQSKVEEQSVTPETTVQGSTVSTTVDSATVSDVVETTVTYTGDDYYSEWQNESVTKISLNGSQITADGSNVSIEGSIATITAAGTYVVEGTLTDGQLRVETKDADNVRIVLNGVTINNTTTAPFYVKKAEKVVVSLEAGTTNTFTDGTEYVFEADSDEPNAAFFSKADLTINGTGTLNVTANYNNGLTSKDGLKIVDGTINVEAADDGLVGKDYIGIQGGTVTLTTVGDGMKSTNVDLDKGYIEISGGVVDVTALSDGIQGENAVYLNGGVINVYTGGGSGASTKIREQSGGKGFPGGFGMTASTTDTSDEVSTKGIKAGSLICVNAGEINIDSQDDSIHTNNQVFLRGGTVDMWSGDDGVHADALLEMTGGTYNIYQSYEGLEAAIINISGGYVNLVASDDGINAAGGDNATSAMGGRPGQDSFNTDNGIELNISGGYIVVEAGGDGIDVNGKATMTGGTVIVNGPTSGADSALDFDVTFDISGGTLIAAGCTGMLEVPSSSSSQPSIVALNTGGTSTGDIFYLTDSSGNVITGFSPSKSAQSIVFSAPELKVGETYTLYRGAAVSGLGEDGAFTEATTITSAGEGVTFTLSETITYVNESGVTTFSGGMGGDRGGNMGGKGNRGDMSNMVPTEIPEGGIPEGGMPQGDIPSGGIPEGGIPEGGIPSGDMPQGDIPSGERPTTDGTDKMNKGNREMATTDETTVNNF